MSVTMNARYLIPVNIIAILFWSCACNAQPVTFTYTGNVQTWVVPPCVNSVSVDVIGARGGSAAYSRAGYGARVQCKLAVTPGQVLEIYVGGKGDDESSFASFGGFNGGADRPEGGGAGGGASDIRFPPFGGSGAWTDRVVVAGGGGGAANLGLVTTDDNRGGDGGGITGEAGYYGGSPVPGGGGTSAAGGTGFGGRPSGALGLGGTGGGGGGFYGGGGSSGGGSGGSSFAHPSVTSSVVHTRGHNSTGNGIVIITPDCTPAGAIAGAVFHVCEGKTITVSNPTSLPCGRWVSSNPSVATIDSVTGEITGIAGGIATITYTVPNPCSALAVRAITVDPAPAPVSGAENICVGNTVTLSSSTVSGSWYSVDPAIATVGLTSGLVTGISVGTTNIDYILPSGCFASTPIVVSCGVGVPLTGAAGSLNVSISPNPAKDNVNIEFSLKGVQRIRCQVIDLTGRVVFSSEQLCRDGVNVISVPLQGNAHGFYMYSLVTNQGIASGKFIGE